MSPTLLERMSNRAMLAVAEPQLGAEEKAALADVIDAGWITMGERVFAFERAFAQTHDAADAVAVSSCTGGLHLALQALGLGPGDEVLVPALTFAATADCVLYVGATPVLVDIESLKTPLMSIEDAGSRCTPRTRAVILVHYAGYLADRAAWQDFATARGLLLIEDAAHAAGLPEAGSFGAAAVFSFYGNKNMTTAEGGMVLAADEELRERMRQMRGHGLTSGTFQRHSAAQPGYDVTMLGFNYRMDELRAAIGLVQLGKLPAWNARRRKLTEVYRALLAQQLPEVTVPFAQGGISSHHIMPVLLPRGVDRSQVIERLRAMGVQTSMHYPPLHRLALYRERFPDLALPIVEDFAAREMTLPLHPGLNEDDLRFVTEALTEAVRGAARRTS
ncbi:DegT/DnrJ/EryC1/StrS aminotransferase family protein [Belnapia sp. T18]|uniref:DegT/DnrJ/EryC1/StrS aminotransferase family protein n=2 Tax=Belnapia arida TaxID=2804533 RepID=A0ABS1UAM7_9PROT|nr:DegT/DnrJ/EryC1/StrS aminotransferase family protein [Belnapia arida]MBL6081175.1 DegT/DnrJ/EryC1/StrS aminotransferase family protein [Belnapia arida]